MRELESHQFDFSNYDADIIPTYIYLGDKFVEWLEGQAVFVSWRIGLYTDALLKRYQIWKEHQHEVKNNNNTAV